MWETGSLRQLGSAETGLIGDLRFASEDNTLEIVHPRGMSRLHATSGPDGTLVYRPKETFDVASAPATASASFRRFAFIRNGKLMVRDLGSVAAHDSASADVFAEQVYDLPNRHDDVLISADGKWAATGGWHSPVTCIWDLVNRRLAEQLRLGPQTGFYFSPGSTQLVTSRWDAYRFWDLQTMRNTLSLRRIDCPQPDSMAISADGRYAALTLRAGELDIVSLPSGTILFRLRRPTSGRPLLLAFSLDTSLLLECGSAPDYLVGMWDLAGVNRQLAGLGLEVPELHIGDGHFDRSQIPHLVCFEGLDDWRQSDFIGRMDEQSAREKLDQLRQAHDRDPASAQFANELAWNLLMAPAGLRDAEQAVRLAESAVGQQPDSTNFRNTLGAAYFRAGKYEAAIQQLERNLTSSPDHVFPWDLFFLSMSHAAIGEPAAAESYLRTGDRWSTLRDENGLLVPAQSREELEFLRAEAHAFLLERDNSATDE